MKIEDYFHENPDISTEDRLKMDVKKKICEGKKKNGNKCDRRLLPDDNFCGTCGTKIEDEDDLDGGNDQNQTDEKNRDQPKQKEKQINETIENTTQ